MSRQFKFINIIFCVYALIQIQLKISVKALLASYFIANNVLKIVMKILQK